MLDAFPLLKNLHPVLKKPSACSTSVLHDIHEMRRGNISRVVLVALPLAGKSTIIEGIRSALADTTIQVVVGDLVGRTFREVMSVGKPLARDSFFAEVNRRLTAKIQQCRPNEGELHVVAFPPLDFDHSKAAGLTTFESVTALIHSGIDDWGKACVWSIAPADKVTLFERANVRKVSYQLMHSDQEQVLNNAHVQEIIRVWGSVEKYISVMADTLPAPRNIAVLENLTYYARVSKESASFYKNFDWDRLLSGIIIPEHLKVSFVEASLLGKEREIAFLRQCVSSYQTAAAYEVWRLRKILNLPPRIAKVIANPQMRT